MLCSVRWLFEFSVALFLPAHGQPLELLAPRSVPAGEEVYLSARIHGKPASGAEIRVRGPAKAAARIGSSGLMVREGPGLSFPLLRVLYPRELVLVLPEKSEGWCRIVTPVSGIGYAPCASVPEEPFGQPLGATDPAGELRTREISAIATSLEIEARSGSQTATRRILITPAEFDRTGQLAAGIRFRERVFLKGRDGPFRMQILEVDANHPAIRILPAR